VIPDDTSKFQFDLILIRKLFRYNFWIANIFKGLKFFRVINLMKAYPLIGMPILFLMKLFPSIQEAALKHRKYSRDKSERRLDTKTDRRDFIRLAHFYVLLIPF